MRIITRHQISTGQYYPVSQIKKQIFLHHTAGFSARGALNWWNDTPEHIGTAFVIDRDGVIYQAFDPTKWAFHLGIVGDSNELEKTSIGIELVAGGGLYEQDGAHFFRYGSKMINGQKQIHEDQVEKLITPYRGFSAFHKYTPEQLISLEELLKKLVLDFKIISPSVKEFDSYWDFKSNVITENLPGIWTHANVRKDKSDIYPNDEILRIVKNCLGIYDIIVKDNPDILIGNSNSSSKKQTLKTTKKTT